MKGRSLCALSALALVVACQDQKGPTAPARNAPTDPSALISDGAHGGNPDFFFLPPMVSNPVGNPNYEPGKANVTLAPSLSVVICQLQSAPVDANGLPLVTDCVAGPAVKTFPAGTVQLQGGAPDGFYQVVWHTQESNLDVTRYYRIKVKVQGSSTPFGAADIDPVANMKEFKNVRTGEVIPLNDDSSLPIKFRIENAGGPTLCDGIPLCTSVVVTNDNPNDDKTVVQVQGNNGPIAGGVFPDGWLPPGGPQNVIVTIKNFNTGSNNVGDGTQSTPCHAGLPVEQFNACFTFTTTPHLDGLAPGGHQFMKFVTVVTCYVLHDTEDPREPWVQQWSSGPTEPPHPLPSVSDALVLTAPTEHNCGTNFDPIITSNTVGSSSLTRLASEGWRAVKGAVDEFLTVKTAYAVDLGLGGSTLDFSNIGPALTAQIQAITSTVTVTQGSSATVTARIVGTQKHNGDPLGDTTATGFTRGIPGLPVTFTLAPGNGTLTPIGGEGSVTQATVLTSPLIDAGSGGFASVNWTPPSTPGTYTMTANGPATGGPVTFTATVTPVIIGFNYLPGFLVALGSGVAQEHSGD